MDEFDVFIDAAAEIAAIRDTAVNAELRYGDSTLGGRGGVHRSGSGNAVKREDKVGVTREGGVQEAAAGRVWARVSAGGVRNGTENCTEREARINSGTRVEESKI
jgi:hypothetical protein